jgi:hypothetical protein
MIKISDQYRIVFDSNNVVLEKFVKIGSPRNKKPGNPRQDWREIAFFSTIKSALRHYAELELQDSNSLEDLVQRLSSFEKRFDELFNI